MPTVNAVNESFREYMMISNSSFHGYYGMYEQFTDDDYYKASVLVIPGNGVGMVDFLTMDDGINVIPHYRDVKNLISDIVKPGNKMMSLFKYSNMQSWPIVSH